jgi:adenine-specific DNA-methyltransferase
MIESQKTGLVTEMAVPVPKKNKSSESSPIMDLGFRLDYEGKKKVEDVLSFPAGLYRSNERETQSKNRLYHADNIGVLAALSQEESIAGKVKLVYIDPPFATAAAFESRKQTHAYDDHLVGPAFVEALRERLIFLHHLLADDGSLYLHLDSRMIFHLRVVLDEIFGPKGFKSCITRKKCNPKNYTKKTYGNVADYILFYTKSEEYIWNRPIEPWGEEKALKEYQYVDADGRRFKKVPVHAPGVRNGETGLAWRGKMPPPGKHWQYTPTTLDEMDLRGDIYWSSTGNPRRKIYLENSSGIPVQDIWLDVRDAHNQNVYITGYPTEKNPSLLSRIIQASSNPGDLVLDCYAGSGTTLAVASDLDRKWIGIDKGDEAIRTILNRFNLGTERMGDFVSVKNPGTSTHTPTTDFCLFEPVDTAVSSKKSDVKKIAVASLKTRKKAIAIDR